MVESPQVVLAWARYSKPFRKEDGISDKGELCEVKSVLIEGYEITGFLKIWMNTAFAQRDV